MKGALFKVSVPWFLGKGQSKFVGGMVIIDSQVPTPSPKLNDVFFFPLKTTALCLKHATFVICTDFSRQ
jgi:hypothetical protein